MEVQVKTAEFADFVATLEDGKYLRVCHYRNDDDPGEGWREVRSKMYDVVFAWGLGIDPNTEWHSGGAAGCHVHPITAEEIRKYWLKNGGWKLKDKIESAACDWWRENGQPDFDRIDVDEDQLIVTNEDESQHAFDDAKLLTFWTWALQAELI